MRLPIGTTLFCLTLASCAPKSAPLQESRGALDRQFRVSVESGGRPVSDFEQSLVHRIVLRSEQVRSALADWPNSVQLPFAAQPELDQSGTVKGFRVTQRLNAPQLSDLGLQRGDVITGVGQRPITDLRQLGEVFESVRSNKLTSITFERSGQPHKSFYFSR